MCQFSSPSDSSKSKVDPSTRVQGSDMLALIPKNPIFQEQHKTDHLSFAIKEARCIAKIYSTSNDINWSFTLFSLHDLQQSQATLFSLAFPWEWNPFVAKLLVPKDTNFLASPCKELFFCFFLTSIPIAFLWFNILLFCDQEDNIATEAQFYILYSP
ncbi:hypothetical protein D5086_000985 [Populus alba]|uniref:Uncharacterized protein n=1 Tax=Populus alba TaxID=43335 RepID=A0ACC4CXM1_POPAL